MLRTLTALGLVMAAPAFAEVEIAQADSQWFKDAQEVISENAAREFNTGRARNVILFVADGNGVGTNYATRLFAGQQAGGLGDDYVLPYEAFPHLALVKTYTVNGQTPDSAPTASAMNAGIKSRNGMINIDGAVARGDCEGRKGNELTTFAEIVSDMGKSVGVISTARLTHATPAAVYAKTADRNWENNGDIPEGCDQPDIAAQMIDALEAGTLDVVMGGGRRNFLPAGVADEEGKDGRRTDDRNLVEEAKELGYQYAWNTETAMDVDPSKPILGLFESSHMQYEADRTDEPSLAEMTELAIKALENNEEGYYLEVEAGRVDHANHGGNAARVVRDGVAFADAVAKAVEMTDGEDTLIIVTADHEHAIAFNGYCGRGSNILGLCMEVGEEGEKHNGTPNMALDGKPYTVLGYLNGAGSILVQEEGSNDYAGSRPELTEEEATDLDYTQQALIPKSSETHSGEDVTVFAQGPWAHLFDGVIEQNVIFHVMNHAVNADE